MTPQHGTPKTVQQLIENSSLGTRSAREARRSVSAATGHYIVRAAARQPSVRQDPRSK